jgi:hypothetical protein
MVARLFCFVYDPKLGKVFEGDETDKIEDDDTPLDRRVCGRVITIEDPAVSWKERERNATLQP